jgi:hypothetical protein
MQEISRNPNEPDRLTGEVNDREIAEALERVQAGKTAKVVIAGPDQIVEIQNGPFKGRRYRVNDLGQFERVKE